MDWQAVRDRLAFLTDWMDPSVREVMDVEAWWLLFLAATLLALLVVGLMLRRMMHRLGRALFGPRRDSWDSGRTEQLDALPQAPRASRQRGLLTVYHLPARLRVVVLAPVQRGEAIDPRSAPQLLDAVLPGLGGMVAWDRPRVLVWEAPLSRDGFAAMFQRRMKQGGEETTAPSPWVLLSGKAQAGERPLFVGVVLEAEQPSTLGAVQLEPHQWFDVLRLKPAEA